MDQASKLFILIGKRSVLLFCLILNQPANAQWRVASSDTMGPINVRQISTPNYKDAAHSRSGIEPRLRKGYPKIFLTHPALKNFRNVTVEDLDDDGADEIILGVADQLMVYKQDEIWWSKPLSGLARFPAAVGDLENDGILDIVILTGFNEDPGMVYAFNARGVDKPGFPKSFGDRWMISSPALADLDNDAHLEIICSDLEMGMGQVYVLKADGTPFNDQWPVTLPNVPAVTPSIGDVDQDGTPDILINSTREIFLFDLEGFPKPGWPFSNGQTKFSFQSPIITDLDGHPGLEIIAAGHGDLPLFLLLDQKGDPLENWPKAVPDKQWTFHPPTVINYRNQALILTGRPITSNQEKPMLFAWRPDGTQLPGFPIVKAGGLEGVISVADIDDDLEPEIIFPSNMVDSLGNGFIHAYELDGSGEIDGFPLKMYGWTFLNGATIGDVDGNGKMDLIILTYTENPGSERDSAFLYVYELDAPMQTDRVWWPTYKGNNLRNGFIEGEKSTATLNTSRPVIKIFPNPVHEFLNIKNDSKVSFDLEIRNMYGVSIYSRSLFTCSGLTVEHLPAGIYFLHAKIQKDERLFRFLKL
ncbi:MAG: T9SS type A sorting domain-containing protein [Saprospiraceae bacterium]|nr:T9SS type A sorting domain-containing protein [Saprospiraceae bacterium]